METVKQFTPQLFISKRFWSAIIGGAIMIAVGFRPELAEQAPQLEGSILVIVMLLISGYSQQDKASAVLGINKYADSPSAPAYDPETKEAPLG